MYSIIALAVTASILNGCGGFKGKLSNKLLIRKEKSIEEATKYLEEQDIKYKKNYPDAEPFIVAIEKGNLDYIKESLKIEGRKEKYTYYYSIVVLYKNYDLNALAIDKDIVVKDTKGNKHSSVFFVALLYDQIEIFNYLIDYNMSLLDDAEKYKKDLNLNYQQINNKLSTKNKKSFDFEERLLSYGENLWEILTRGNQPIMGISPIYLIARYGTVFQLKSLIVTTIKLNYGNYFKPDVDIDQYNRSFFDMNAFNNAMLSYQEWEKYHKKFLQIEIYQYKYLNYNELFNFFGKGSSEELYYHLDDPNIDQRKARVKNDLEISKKNLPINYDQDFLYQLIFNRKYDNAELLLKETHMKPYSLKTGNTFLQIYFNNSVLPKKKVFERFLRWTEELCQLQFKQDGYEISENLQVKYTKNKCTNNIFIKNKNALINHENYFNETIMDWLHLYKEYSAENAQKIFKMFFKILKRKGGLRARFDSDGFLLKEQVRNGRFSEKYLGQFSVIPKYIYFSYFSLGFTIYENILENQQQLEIVLSKRVFGNNWFLPDITTINNKLSEFNNIKHTINMMDYLDTLEDDIIKIEKKLTKYIKEYKKKRKRLLPKKSLTLYFTVSKLNFIDLLLLTCKHLFNTIISLIQSLNPKLDYKQKYDFKEIELLKIKYLENNGFPNIKNRYNDILKKKKNNKTEFWEEGTPTPFIIACEKGNMVDVGRMIEEYNNIGIDLADFINMRGFNSEGKGFFTGLSVAIYNKQYKIVEYLLTIQDKKGKILLDLNCLESLETITDIGDNLRKSSKIKYLKFNTLGKESHLIFSPRFNHFYSYTGKMTVLDYVYSSPKYLKDQKGKKKLLSLLKSKSAKSYWHNEKGNNYGRGMGDLNITKDVREIIDLIFKSKQGDLEEILQKINSISKKDISQPIYDYQKENEVIDMAKLGVSDYTDISQFIFQELRSNYTLNILDIVNYYLINNKKNSEIADMLKQKNLKTICNKVSYKLLIKNEEVRLTNLLEKLKESAIYILFSKYKYNYFEKLKVTQENLNGMEDYELEYLFKFYFEKTKEYKRIIIEKDYDNKTQKELIEIVNTIILHLKELEKCGEGIGCFKIIENIIKYYNLKINNENSSYCNYFLKKVDE